MLFHVAISLNNNNNNNIYIYIRWLGCEVDKDRVPLKCEMFIRIKYIQLFTVQFTIITSNVRLEISGPQFNFNNNGL